MHRSVKGFLVIATAAAAALAAPAHAGVPSTTNSFFVPQTGTTASPVEGTDATKFFRGCPNNDLSSGTSLPNNARLKVTVLDQNGNGIPGVAAADICVLFNGGTAAQGFSGIGADSVISNSAFNALCPDLRCITADKATDANGETYITFAGADPLVPGVAFRNANRKWGHYDTELPVYALGFKLSGKLTSGAAIGTYTLRIKSYDFIGGLAAAQDEGVQVGNSDFNTMANNLFDTGPLSYWRDLDWDGAVGNTDLNLVVNHATHGCISPQP
jgi:hypothetical protein